MRIETDRLVIRSWTEADIGTYADIISKASVMKYIGDGQPETYESARRFITGGMDDEKAGKPIFWAVETKTTRALIGFCGFGRCNDEVDMGWRYDDRHWGMGYGSEAAKAVLDYGLQAYGFKRIISRADPDNVGSIKIMRKLGFTLEKEVTNGDVRRVIFSLTKS